MAFHEEVYRRARGQCECTMKTCGHSGRCPATLRAHAWHVHHLTAGGADVLSNVLGLCKECHENTPSYGVGRR